MSFFRHSAVLVKVKPETIVAAKSVYSASRCCWKAKPDRANQHDLVLVAMKGTIVAAFDDCHWSRYEHRPGRSQFTAQEAPDAIARLYVRKELPERLRQSRAVVQYIWPSS